MRAKARFDFQWCASNPNFALVVVYPFAKHLELRFHIPASRNLANRHTLAFFPRNEAAADHRQCCGKVSQSGDGLELALPPPRPWRLGKDGDWSA